MSYMALYRKWRPTTFEDVKGQDHIVQSHPVEEAMLALKDFMFASVYTNPLAKG